METKHTPLTTHHRREFRAAMGVVRRAIVESLWSGGVKAQSSEVAGEVDPHASKTRKGAGRQYQTSRGRTARPAPPYKHTTAQAMRVIREAIKHSKRMKG